MAPSKKIRIMISSRCNDEFPTGSGQLLSETRIRLKQEIEAAKTLENSLFEVWINEDAPPADATQDSWETCLRAVRECDILIVLSNGNAGWAKSGGDIGICHAEYMEGLGIARGKVRLIELPAVPEKSGEEGDRNRLFKAYLDKQTAFRGGSVQTVEDLRRRVFGAINDAIVTLTQRGLYGADSSRFDLGQALDWSRLDFKRRKAAMEAVLVDSLCQKSGAKRVDDGVTLPIGGVNVAILCHAIPAALSVPTARELVGQPFLTDHQQTHLLKAAHGPLHIIACHRTATETQATKMLGFPDTTVVSGPFGIYVSDDIQKVQFVFLTKCRDESFTRHALQRFFEWLDQAEEANNLAKRAVSRAKIVKLIAKEI